MEKRNINIDLLKVVALFFVILVHFYAYTGYYDFVNKSGYYNLELKFSLFIRNLAMTCVPLFIIISGYLLGFKKASLSYYKKFGSIFLIYSLAMFFVTLVDNLSNINHLLIKKYILNVFMFEYYGWYVSMYFGLFILAPVLNGYYYSLSNRREKKFLLFSLILLISIPVTISDIMLNIGYDTRLSLIPNWWIHSWPLMYYVIGLYIREYFEKIKFKNIIIYLLIVMIATEVFYLFFNIKRETLLHVNIFIVIQSVIVTLLVLNISRCCGNNILEKIVLFLSKSSLQFYLLSKIVDIKVYVYLNEIFANHILLYYVLLVVIFNFFAVTVLTLMFNALIFLIKELRPIISAMIKIRI